MVYESCNDLTKELRSVLMPQAALIAYKGTGVRERSYYLEFRKIDEKGVMGAGLPVPCSFLNDIAENYVDSTGGTPHGVLPPEFLFCDTRRGSERYVWYVPPGLKQMYFSSSLEIESGLYHVPGLIFVAGSNSLKVFAVKDKKPTEKSVLHYGPFFNTTQGSVCLGNYSIKKPLNPTFAELQEYWENRFWKTEFTHLGGESNPTKDNLVFVTKNAAGEPFDLDQLRPSKHKLKDLYK